MIRRHSIAITFLHLVLSVGVPCSAILAQTPPERERIGEALGKPVFRDQLEGKPGSSMKSALHQLFLSKAIANYRLEHKSEITPTPDEIRFAAAHFDAQHAERIREKASKLRDRIKQLDIQLESESLTKEEQTKLRNQKSAIELELEPPGRSFAAWMLENRKLQRHLYEEFGGGRVLFQQGGLEAFDATRLWLKSLEKVGDFRIDDKALRDQLFAYWTTQDHGAFLSKEPETIKEFLYPAWIEKTEVPSSN